MNRAIWVRLVLPDCVTAIVKDMSTDEVMHLIEHGLDHALEIVRDDNPHQTETKQ